MTTHSQTLDETITDYQQAIDAQAAEIAALANENETLRLDNTLLETRIACIRKRLEEIETVAGYPALQMAQKALRI